MVSEQPTASNALIYVVEDDAALRSAYAAALTGLGYQVKTAADGVEGQQLLKAGRPALILLDMVMPNMDGAAFLEALRANDAVKDIKVVVVSSFEMAPTVEGLKIDQYLSKMQNPPEQVAAVVHRILHQGA